MFFKRNHLGFVHEKYNEIQRVQLNIVLYDTIILCGNVRRILYIFFFFIIYLVFIGVLTVPSLYTLYNVGILYTYNVPISENSEYSENRIIDIIE